MRIHIRASQADKAMLDALAQDAQLKPSDYLRRLIYAEHAKLLDRKKKEGD